VLKGIGLDNKDLGRFWNTVCPEAQHINRSQFKLFCKYCAVLQANMPFTAESFSTFIDPAKFPKSAETQHIGQTAVDRLQASRVQPVHYQAREPHVMGSPGQYAQDSFSNINSNAFKNDSSSASYNYGQSSTYQSQLVDQHDSTPHTPIMQGVTGTSQAEGLAAQCQISGINVQKITPDDFVSIKRVVECIPAVNTEQFTFDELKSIILAFKLTNTKEATRIWKLVDQTSRRVVSKEGRPQLIVSRDLVVLPASDDEERCRGASHTTAGLRQLHQEQDTSVCRSRQRR
jgi:hypothetical protein